MAGNALDELFAALVAGNVAAAADWLGPGARVWHCFDRISQDRAGATAEWQAFVDAFPERSFSRIRSQATDGGLVRQHVMTVRDASGQAKAWEACIVARLEHGRIARLEEYLDRAGHFRPAGEPE